MRRTAVNNTVRVRTSPASPGSHEVNRSRYDYLQQRPYLAGFFTRFGFANNADQSILDVTDATYSFLFGGFICEFINKLTRYNVIYYCGKFK